MKSIVILFAIQLAYNNVLGLQCNGTNEFESGYTPLCPIQCDNINKVRCLGMLEKASCQCKAETVRDTKTNKCVTIDQCSDVHYNSEPLLCEGENEVFSEVVSACPRTCNHPTGPICMALIRKPSCVCTAGTIRDTVNNKCVPREQCPQKEAQPVLFDEKIVCNGLNEVFAEWVSACPSVCRKTASPPLPEKCLAIVHKPSCICTGSTIRDTINNKCVTPDQCPPIQNLLTKNYNELSQLKCSQENERLSPMTTCQASCQRPWVPRCDMAVNLEPSCVCVPGTIRDTVSGKCVHLKDCPNRIIS